MEKSNSLCPVETPSEPDESVPTTEIWKNYIPTANRLDVFRFLASSGWALSRSTFYRHLDSGKLRKNNEGVYSKNAVKKYASTWAVRTSGQTITEEVEDLAAEKTRSEIKRINTIQARESFRLDIERGKYLKRDDLELQLAGRAVALEAGFDHLVYTRASEFIVMVGGDTSRADLLIAAMMEAKDEWLRSYVSTDGFEITIDGGTDDDTDDTLQ